MCFTHLMCLCILCNLGAFSPCIHPTQIHMHNRAVCCQCHPWKQRKIVEALCRTTHGPFSAERLQRVLQVVL